MSHDEFTGLAAGYALSALDADDLKLFEAHLASCPECRASVAGLRPLVDCLSVMNDEVAPPAGLRERIVATAVAEPKRPEPASRATPGSKAPWWRRPVLWPLPVAAVITVLAVAVAVASVWGSQTGGDLATSERRLDLCIASHYPPHFLPTSDGCFSSWVITRSISVPSSSTETASVTI